MTAEDRTPVVYQWDFARSNGLSDPEREAVNAFLAAHGISPMAFLEGSSLTVHQYANDPNRYHLETWRAVGNDAQTAPICEHCPACIAQEPVRVPLAAPVPLVGSAYVSRKHVQVVEPGDEPPADGWAAGPLLPATVVDGYRYANELKADARMP